MKIKFLLVTGALLSSVFMPVTALADSNSGSAWGSVQQNGDGSKTVDVGGNSNPSKSDNGNSNTKNGGSDNSKPGKPGSPGSSTNTCDANCQLQNILQSGIDLGQYAAQYQAGQNNDPSGAIWTKNFDTGTSGQPGLDQTTRWTTTTGSEQIGTVIPLWWDWQFQNKTDGKALYRNSGPMKTITETFNDPGHYYVYYHEYDKWETGYYTYVTGTVTVWYNGASAQQSFTYPEWHGTGWHEGYLTGWKYLLDFSLADNQVPHTWCVPGCVGQTQLDTSTVQTVAH